jgi:hypothetical protein
MLLTDHCPASPHVTRGWGIRRPLLGGCILEERRDTRVKMCLCACVIGDAEGSWGLHGFRSSVYTLLSVHSSHQRSSIHGGAAPETVHMLKSSLLACSWSGPEQPNIGHCLQAGHWHRVTHRCPRNGAVGIRTSNLGSVELRTAGMHARTSFPRLLIPTVRDVPVVGYILRPPTYTIPAATGVYPQAEMPTPLQPFLIVQASSSALQQ